MSGEDGTISVGILTVSDTCSRGEAMDKSGPLLEELVTSSGLGKVSFKHCVPDEEDAIRQVLTTWSLSASGSADIILTTGGTGFAPRDVTPEATLPLLDKQAPGIVQAMLGGSLAVTPMAALSRPAAGIRNNTIIVNLPGSSKAVKECFGFIKPVLRHAVDLVKDRKPSVKNVHSALQSGISNEVKPVFTHTCGHHKHEQSKGPAVEGVAGRDRVSPYPMLTVQQAQSIVLEQCRSVLKQFDGCPVLVTGVETVDFREALGRTLCQDVFASEPLPPFPASIKDGYAVVSSDGVGVRQVRGESSAGYSPDIPPLKSGEVIRINTGAPVPSGADAVVMVENTKLVAANSEGEEEKIEILSAPQPGLDIRPIGSDIAKGEKVLAAGCLLGAGEVGIMATVGAIKVRVASQPLVGVLSTGNEIQEPGDDLLPGHVRDSNKTTLLSLLKQNGFEAIDCGIAKDDLKSLKAKLSEALSQCQLLVTTGGVSMGDRDLLRQVLINEFGANIHFARVNMKPGKPTTFATCQIDGQQKMILGLPGNPVSATVTCHLYVLPACRQLAGHAQPLLGHLRARLALSNPIKLDPRPEYMRVVVKYPTGSGVGIATPTGNQISSRLTSVAAANGLIILPGKTEKLQELKPGHEEDFDVLQIGPILA